jgi:hypothetical protein
MSAAERQERAMRNHVLISLVNKNAENKLVHYLKRNGEQAIG